MYYDFQSAQIINKKIEQNYKLCILKNITQNKEIFKKK